MVEERQVWENKYKAESREITELKFKLGAEKIGQAELREENHSIQNALRVMEQSLVEHKCYIIELQEDSIRKTMQYEKTLTDLWEDKEGWKA